VKRGKAFLLAGTSSTEPGKGSEMKIAAKVATLAAFVLAAVSGSLADEPKPAPVNPYKGRQTRESVFEFAQKPKVAKEGEKCLITFASKGKCDATVAITGPDGKIVRHLASGVLGNNAPWPFQQGTLTQSIEWDGKDDAGKPAGTGCKVRVSLGLNFVFDKALGWSGGAINDVAGMAVDSRGQLYVLGAPNARVGNRAHIRVFDKEGRYLRTIMPHPATVPPERMTLIEWTRTAWGGAAIYRPRSGGARIFDRYRYPGFMASIEHQSPVITPDGRLAFISDFLPEGWGLKDSGRKLILLDTRDGASPPGSILEADRGARRKAGVLGCGRIFMALSPGGKWLYLGGAERITRSRHDKKALHALSRISLQRPGPAERFIGEFGTAGDDDAHFNQPRGVACDGAGNIYVADYGNDRIQVFQPDGTHLKTIALEKPDQLAVHPRTGHIYVLCALPKGRHFNMKLVKLGGLSDPAVGATLGLPQSQFRITQAIALDAASDPPAVWVSADPRKDGAVGRGAAKCPTSRPTPSARSCMSVCTAASSTARPSCA